MRDQSVDGRSARKRRPSRRQRAAAERAAAVARAERAAGRVFVRYQAAESELLALLGAGAKAERVREAKARTARLAREVVAARAAIEDAKAGRTPAPAPASQSLGAELAELGGRIGSSDHRRPG